MPNEVRLQVLHMGLDWLGTGILVMSPLLSGDFVRWFREVTNVPASHGQWAGYRMTKAVASVINMAPGQWLARCGCEASGPSSFNEAKANALGMARGSCGDYFIENPIDHLNRLQARLLDRDAEVE